MKKNEKNYRDAIIEIEDIIKKLENSNADVDEMVKEVKKATELIQFCKNKLHATEQELNAIISD